MGKAAPPFQAVSSPTESNQLDPNSTVAGDASSSFDDPQIENPQTEATPETLVAPGQAAVQARRSRRGVSGVTLLVSIALHGLVLGLPAPEPAPQPDLSIEPAPSLDRLDAVTFDPAPMVEPDPDPEPEPESPPDPAPNSAQNPGPRPAPAPPPAARAPSPAAPAAPAPDPADAAAQEPVPTASPPDPSPDPLPTPSDQVTPPDSPDLDLEELEGLEGTETAEEPQAIAGVPILPGGELISDLPSSLPTTRLERYRQGGSRHPDILGQYLLRVSPEESPEQVFQQRYRDLFDPNEFRVEPHGALAGGGVSAPQYRLRRQGETTSQFITLERLPAPDQDKLLITIWRRLPS